ncbi:helix-turn-helix domain-containing protein [Streptomyces sp. ID05-04B]|uniref:helix-turn-helix domain-containing protein n=1 Tax=Streptomyces sp. ID05-04B TaxID=3028661 RepID=UPI0029CA02C1|nr:helix-turn-helix domain-containing protein [Streptomyces sp. ID05-04B]
MDAACTSWIRPGTAWRSSRGPTAATSRHRRLREAVAGQAALTVAKARKAKGESVTAIANTLGVSRATLYRHIGQPLTLSNGTPAETAGVFCCPR